MKNNLKELKEKIEKGCGRRFRCKRWQKPTLTQPEYFISVIICGNNLTNTLCPECKTKLKLLNQVEEINNKWKEEFNLDKIRKLGALLIKNIYWEQGRCLMPYDSTTYILPFAGELAELLKIDLHGNLKTKDKIGSWRTMNEK